MFVFIFFTFFKKRGMVIQNQDNLVFFNWVDDKQLLDEVERDIVNY